MAYGSFVGLGNHLFGGIHWIAPNVTKSPADVRGFVAMNRIVDGGVDITVENRNGSWNYFGVQADGTVTMGQQLNPAYDAATNPNVSQYVPLQFDDAAAAKAAYDALV